MHDVQCRAGDLIASGSPRGASEASVTIASGFGATPAQSWPEIPVVEDVDGVAEAAACAAGMAVSLP